MPNMNLAAIDLGTNSCRLSITDADGRQLYRDSIATMLGEGLHANKRFSDAAVNRGLKAFDTYAKIMKNHEVGPYRAIATAACRIAQNGADFVAEVARQTGIRLEVIDGYEEARLSLKGALLNAPANAEYAVVYDLGGGSTELSFARIADTKILHTVSIPWGARNAAEAFGLAEFNAEHNQKLSAEIAAYTDDFVQKSKLEQYRPQTCLLATSSTPLRLVSIANRWGIYEREKSDGQILRTAAADKIIADIYQTTLEQRIESPYIGENRAPIMIAACTIFKTIYDHLGFDRLTASLKSAQEGIIEELKTNG